MNNLKVVDALKQPGSRERFDVAHVVLQVRLVLAPLLKLSKRKQFGFEREPGNLIKEESGDPKIPSLITNCKLGLINLINKSKEY